MLNVGFRVKGSRNLFFVSKQWGRHKVSPLNSGEEKPHSFLEIEEKLYYVTNLFLYEFCFEDHALSKRWDLKPMGIFFPKWVSLFKGAKSNFHIIPRRYWLIDNVSSPKNGSDSEICFLDVFPTNFCNLEYDNSTTGIL